MNKLIIQRTHGEPVELAPDRILTNNVIFPWETNYRHCRLWLIGNEYGLLAAAWGNEQDALDEAYDADLLKAFAVDEDDFAKMDEKEREGLNYLGNVSEPADLQHLWMEPVPLEKQSQQFIAMLAEARGAGANTCDL